MRIAVTRETDANESRVAATPDTVKKMKALGAEIAVEPDAGTQIRHSRRRVRRRRRNRRRPTPSRMPT